MCFIFFFLFCFLFWFWFIFCVVLLCTVSFVCLFVCLFGLCFLFYYYFRIVTTVKPPDLIYLFFFFSISTQTKPSTPATPAEQSIQGSLTLPVISSPTTLQQRTFTPSAMERPERSKTPPAMTVEEFFGDSFLSL